MKSRFLVPSTLACAFGLSLLPLAQADTLASGTFTADNSSYEYSFTTSVLTNYTFTTTSYTAGGFVPVLTLFNANDGSVIANDGSGTGEASLEQQLAAGSYDLFLTEFPNVAVGNLRDGFLFATSPTVTGDFCSGKAGSSFVDDVDCSQRTSAYSLTYSAVPAAATPEPSSWLLVLPGAGILAYTSRRRLAA